MLFYKNNVNAAIFDMDGTMFDTERLRMKMLMQASEMIYGKILEEKILIDCLGLSATSSEELIKKEYGKDYPYKEIRKKADELELEYVRKNGVPIKKGLFDVLERLKKNGVLLAVATSSKRSIAEEYLMSSYAMKYFDIIVCGDEVKKGKPDPEIFLKAASELNCNPSKCLIFEDSENGLRAAIASGAMPIFLKDIKEPNDEIKSNIFKGYNSMIEFLDDLCKFTYNMPVPKINENFPQRFNHMKVGIHGFGAIGGGYLTQIFSHWDGYTRPVEIIGAMRSEKLRKIINSLGKFNVYYESLAYNQTITNVNIIDIKNETAMKNMYAQSEIIGLSLPEAAINRQSSIIAKGLIERDKVSGKDLTILVVLNKIGGAQYVRKSIEKALNNLVDKEKALEIINKTFFTETVVNRMVSKISEKSIMRQIKMNLKNIERNIEKKDLNIKDILKFYSKTDYMDDNKLSGKVNDFSKAIQELSKININLFNSEPDMTLYASNESPILQKLRQIKVVDDIEKMQEIKNKLSNGTHAIIAWYSSILGYKTIGQGMGDKRIISLTNDVMKNEIKPALLKDNPELSDYMDSFISNFIKRCRYSFKDPCIRVGRDPMRKLQKNERIFGTIDLANKNGIKTPLLEFGAALGLIYAIYLINPEDKECQLIKNMFDERESIRYILTHPGDVNSKSYHGLDMQKDSDLITRIENRFNELSPQLLEKVI